MADYQSSHTGEKIDEAIDTILYGQLVEKCTTQANRASSEADRAEEAVITNENVIESSKSWAVGGTGTRPGEDTDNAKYWAGKAAEIGKPGDMTKSVYDPQNKATDIFKYIDDARGGGNNRNLLDNWYFGNPVNQRGKTEYTVGYTIDRWYTEGTAKLENGSLVISGNPTIQRKDETFVKSILGREVTISVLLTDGTFGSETTRIPNAETPEFSTFFSFKVGNLTVMMCFGKDNTQRQFPRLQADVGTTTSIKAVKLELGSQQTLAHQENGKWVLNEIPDYGQELLKCQRYQVVYKGDGVPIATGYATDATHILACIDFPVTMRSSPKIIYNGSLVMRVYEGTTAIAKAVNNYGFGGDKVQLYTESRPEGNFTVGTGSDLYLTGAESSLIFDANL